MPLLLALFARKGVALRPTFSRGAFFMVTDQFQGNLGTEPGRRRIGGIFRSLLCGRESLGFCFLQARN